MKSGSKVKIVVEFTAELLTDADIVLPEELAYMVCRDPMFDPQILIGTINEQGDTQLMLESFDVTVTELRRPN